MSTTIVGPPLPPPPARRARRSRGRAWPALLAALVLALVVSTFVQVPYWAILPGDTRGVADLVEVPAEAAHPPTGEIRLVTVSQRRETLLRWLLDRWDDDVELLTREQLFGTQTPEESRQQNIQAMSDSQLIARYVAFTRLGYDVDATGGGAVIASVTASAPAAEALAVGDVIVEVEGREVNLAADVGLALEGRRPGDVVDVSVERDGEVREEDLELIESEDGRTIIGIIPVTDADVDFDFPVEVVIDPGRVVGPSAGLAFTLTLIDELSPGELTGGRRVAATGTIGLAGEIGPVGGVRQKAVAVREDDAELFLVPADLEDVARTELGDDVEVVGVRTIDEAIDALVERGGADPRVQPST